MRPMFFADPPPFGEVLRALTELEGRINEETPCSKPPQFRTLENYQYYQVLGYLLPATERAIKREFCPCNSPWVVQRARIALCRSLRLLRHSAADKARKLAEKPRSVSGSWLCSRTRL